MDNYLDHLGDWPKNVSELVKKKEITVITERNAINFIHGKENQNKVSFYLSNDMVHVGILTLTRGKLSDIESTEEYEKCIRAEFFVASCAFAGLIIASFGLMLCRSTRPEGIIIFVVFSILYYLVLSVEFRSVFL